MRYVSRLVRAAATSLFIVTAGTGPLLAEGAAASAQTDLSQRTVSTFVAERQPAEWTLTFTGVLVARDEIAVGTALQDQRIASVEVEVGEHVKAGQVLVRLETAMLENKLRESEGRVARSKAGLAQQQATLAQTQSALERAERLRMTRTISEQTYEDRASAVAVAKQGVAVQRAENAEAQAQRAEAERQLERAIVRASADGVISERLARAGAQAGAEPLIRLIRDGAVEFAAEVPEADLPALAIGQPVKVKLAGRSGEIDGKVRIVAPKIDRETRLGSAQIALDTREPLFAGAFGKAEVVFARREAIVVADSALVYGRGTDDCAVFVVNDGRVQRRPVETGLRKSGKVEIRSGLEPGERIVAKAGAALREGDAVTIVDLMQAGSVKK
nr:efflux RND transporter periplasmic adaptor subunit [Mesorhizobium loti]